MSPSFFQLQYQHGSQVFDLAALQIVFVAWVLMQYAFVACFPVGMFRFYDQQLWHYAYLLLSIFRLPLSLVMNKQSNSLFQRLCYCLKTSIVVHRCELQI